MKKALVTIIAMLLLLTCSAYAANFTLGDYSDDELRNIRAQISDHFASHQRGDVIYEDDSIAIYYLGWKKEYSSHELWVTAVNKTDLKLMIASDDTSINDAACMAFSAFTVPAGKRANNSIISVSESTLDEQWIDKIEYTEFVLKYYDDDDWNGLRVEIEKPFVINYIEP